MERAQRPMGFTVETWEMEGSADGGFSPRPLKNETARSSSCEESELAGTDTQTEADVHARSLRRVTSTLCSAIVDSTRQQKSPPSVICLQFQSPPLVRTQRLLVPDKEKETLEHLEKDLNYYNPNRRD